VWEELLYETGEWSEEYGGVFGVISAGCIYLRRMTASSLIKITSLPLEFTEIVGVYNTLERVATGVVKSSYANVFAGPSVYGTMTEKISIVIPGHSRIRKVNYFKFRQVDGFPFNVQLP
jgi:hypothetical protein